MANIIKSVRSMLNFLVSEANDWRSRDEVTFSAEGLTEDVPVATLVQKGATADDPYVPWDGSGDADGILAQAVKAGEEVQRTIISRDAEVVGEDLALPDGVDVEEAAAALRGVGIIVRINKGRHIDVVDPA